MLISYQWPAIAATRKVSSGLIFSRNQELEAVLQRLQNLLKSDYVVAATIQTNAEINVIGSVGSHQDDAIDHLVSFVEPQRACGSYDRRGSVQIVLVQAAETGGSILSLRLPVGAQMTVAIIAVRRACRSCFTSNDERALYRYADWVADYIALWWKLQIGEQRRVGLERALDQVGLAMIMLDRDGRKVGANAVAHDLLAAGDGLIAVGETLSAAVFDDAVRLHSAIGHALVGTMQGARAPVLTIRRKRRRPLVIAVLRVAADPEPGETAIVLQVVEPDRDHDSAITAACTLFGFTGAEVRLAKLLVRGASLAEAAETLRIQMPTARTYLKQAFAKSGTNRQAALVQTLLSSLVHPGCDTVLTTV